jgi:hypothetical protein
MMHMHDDVIIHVACSFVDFEASEALKTQVFPAIVKDKGNNGNYPQVGTESRDDMGHRVFDQEWPLQYAFLQSGIVPPCRSLRITRRYRFSFLAS